MNILAFQHVSLAVTDLEKSKLFYSEVLGLKELPRPNFTTRGAWFKLGDKQELHLIVTPEPTLRQRCSVAGDPARGRLERDRSGSAAGAEARQADRRGRNHAQPEAENEGGTGYSHRSVDRKDLLAHRLAVRSNAVLQPA